MALWAKALKRAKMKARDRWKVDTIGVRTLVIGHIAIGVVLFVAGELTVSSIWTRIASILAPLILYPLTVAWYWPGEASEIWREGVVAREHLAKALEDEKAAREHISRQDFGGPGTASGDRYTIIVANLTGDVHEAQTRHVVRSLRDFAGVAIHRVPDTVDVSSFGDVAANLASAQGRARSLASQYNGDLVIWGEVLKADGLLDLRISTRDHVHGLEGAYPLDGQLKLPSGFDSALASLLFVTCVTRIVPRLGAARVGAAEDLVREANRLRPLLANSALDAEERRALSSAYGTAALTIFECTGDMEWLSAAMTLVEGPDAAKMEQATAEDLTFHARLWLAAADQMPFSRLIHTAMTWLDRAVAAAGGARTTHWVLKAWGLRQLSRLQESPGEQEKLLAAEREAWDATAASLPKPANPDDIAHLKLGTLRERAVTDGDLVVLGTIVADHDVLKPAAASRAVLEHVQSLVEYGVEADDAASLSKAQLLVRSLLDREDVQQSASMADLLKVLEYRSRIPKANKADLQAFEIELDPWRPISTYIMAMRGIALAELHLRMSPLMDTSLESMKQLLHASTQAIFSKKVIHYQDFHVIEQLAKRRFDTAADRLEILKAQAAGQAQG